MRTHQELQHRAHSLANERDADLVRGWFIDHLSPEQLAEFIEWAQSDVAESMERSLGWAKERIANTLDSPKGCRS